MTEGMHVLIVEDLPTDAELTEREILKVLGECQFRRVETRDEYIAALGEFQPALIVSDFKLPQFDGLSALRLALEHCPDVPFIILTGSMNEDTAVECMKAGAWDYVIKEHVKRLGPAILAALERQRMWVQRKQAEKQILDHRANLNAVLESVDYPIFSLDRAYHYTGFNRAHAIVMKELYGVDTQLGTALTEHQLVQEDWRITRKNVDRALQGETAIDSVVAGDENRSRRYFEIAYHPVRTDSGDIIGVSVFARDVTRQKRLELEHQQLEEQLRTSQKMEAIGVLAGGIAHDFNNLLSVILSYTGFALAESKGDGDLHDGLLETKKAAERAVTLTRQLLAFSRKQVLQPVTLNLNAIVTGVEKMLRRVLREDIEFVQVLAPDLDMTRADPGQMEQVLMNLVVNARDAMPNGGTLIIETSNLKIDEEFASRQIGVIAGPYVQLLVRDTGHGMDEQTCSRIFEPFFTTKDQDRGTGLGLSTVYGIVKQSNGNIWVDSEPDRGTTFRICLPSDFTAAAARSSLPMSIRRRRGNETILVVDDDDTVCKVVRLTLEKAGYTVLVAASREEALQVFARHTGKVHLLLSDVVMPYMSGKVLADDLLKLRPAIRILYMSGYTENAIVRQGTVEPGVQFIAKPFTTGELMEKVREVLDSCLNDDSDGYLPVAPVESATRGRPDVDVLQALPSDVLSRLLRAVITRHHDDIVREIETIGTTNPDLAAELRRMVDSFQYEALQDLLGR